MHIKITQPILTFQSQEAVFDKPQLFRSLTFPVFISTFQGNKQYTKRLRNTRLTPLLETHCQIESEIFEFLLLTLETLLVVVHNMKIIYKTCDMPV